MGNLRWVNPTSVQKQRKDVNTGSVRAVCPQTEPGWVPAAAEFIEDLLLKPVLPEKWKDPIGQEDYGKFGPGKGLHPDCMF